MCILLLCQSQLAFMFPSLESLRSGLTAVGKTIPWGCWSGYISSVTKVPYPLHNFLDGIDFLVFSILLNVASDLIQVYQ